MKTQFLHFEASYGGHTIESSDLDARATDGLNFLASPEREKLLDGLTDTLYWVDRTARVENKIRKVQLLCDKTQEATIKKAEASHLKFLRSHFEECCEQLKAASLQLAKQADEYAKHCMD